MAAKFRWWIFQSSSDSLVRFTRNSEDYVLMKNIEGDIGVIGMNTTTWYAGDHITGSEDNQGLVQIPLLTLIGLNDQIISDALRRHARDMEAFGHRRNMFGLDDGTLYGVLVSSEHRGDHLGMTLAFCFTRDILIPDFEGVELDTIFVGDNPRSAPRLSRYKRPWVI